MRNLLDGIHHFQEQIFDKQANLFRDLSRGQAPSTLFICCSDSRIVPNLFTQTAPGELFSLRNAGNIVPPYGASTGGEAATIEYAVSVLGVKHVIICGHSGCGAIGALLSPESVRGMTAITTWLNQAEATRRIIEENYADLPADAVLNVAVQENVLVQIENLETHPSVRSRISRGNLTLHAWVYKIETGQVFEYSPSVRRFVAVGQSDLAVPESHAAAESRWLLNGSGHLRTIAESTDSEFPA